MSDFTTSELLVDHGPGTEHLVDGDEVSTAFANQFGGDDYYDPDHQLLMRTEDNVHGGETYKDADGRVIAETIPNPDGGVDLHSADMTYLGKTHDTAVGRVLEDASGNLVAMDLDLGHGFHDVMHHADPLLYAGDYAIPDLDLMK